MLFALPTKIEKYVDLGILMYEKAYATDMSKYWTHIETTTHP